MPRTKSAAPADQSARLERIIAAMPPEVRSQVQAALRALGRPATIHDLWHAAPEDQRQIVASMADWFFASQEKGEQE